MKVLLFYENINREYETLVLLKHELEKRGHKVKISHFGFHNWGFHFLFSAPDIIASPWLRYDENVARWAWFRRWKKNTKIVNLQWEQVYSRKGLESGLANTDGESLKAIHLCWGKQSFQRLRSQGIAEKNLYINGPMQFDMCRPEYHGYFKKREELAAEFALPADKPWGLYISSFSYATLRPEQLAEINKIGGDYSDMVNISISSRNKTLDWIERFVKNNPDQELIYRPHPAEHTDKRILEMAEANPNLHIISKYSIKQWIFACDRIGLWFSTSAGEIHAIGKNYKIFRPEPLLEYYDVEYMIDAEKCESEAEFNDFFAGKYTAGNSPISAELMGQYYDVDPETSSIKRTADIFEKIAARTDEQKFDLTSENAMAFKKQLTGKILLSLFTSIYQYSFIKFSKLFPVSALKRCDAFFTREKVAVQIEKQLMNFLNKENM